MEKYEEQYLWEIESGSKRKIRGMALQNVILQITAVQILMSDVCHFPLSFLFCYTINWKGFLDI